ncbi:proton-conducting transporter membrane subunit [Methanoregula sp.]|uniref:proton-conducting transporter transmembrane domain-containing protein n=1 Tax=Methanoregula sp. TaxID=2052170 RepID=UPI002374E7FD|nr:proton-conducting transporter membrane subunit [Methanoregula sp.]MDD1687624.1 hydrogenase membrane subunit [Methanoregula sp.]
MIQETLFVIALLVFVAGILIPLATASRDQRIFRIVSHGCTVIGSAALGILALLVLLTGDGLSWTLYQPLPGCSLSVTIDRLAAFFLLLIAAVSACVALYTAEYVEHLEGGSRRNLLCACTNLFILAMALVVVSANTFAFLIFWELMAGCSFLLVMYDYAGPETRKAGIFYFVMTQLSTLFVLLGIVLLYGQTGSFAFTRTGVSLIATLAFIALLIGFSIKAGIIPFHKWLPYAHPASPTPISALMSGVMLKIAVYGLLRFLLDVFSPDLWWGILILILGIVSAVLGIIYALKEYDIKAMLAYSSIENTGIIFTGIGLYVIFASSGQPVIATISLLGALFHALNHAMFKSLLFLTAGSVVHATHTRDIEHMGGLVHRMPCTSALFFVGALAIAALPPLNGFASEILIFISFFSSVAVADPLFKVFLFLCLGLFALTSALSAACFVKAFGSIFLALPRSPESSRAQEVPFLMLLGPALLASACIVLGLFAAQLFLLVGLSVPIPDMFLVGLLLLAMAFLTFAVLYFTASREVRVTGTWGCGTPSLKPAMEYSGHGFSEPIEIIFSTVYRTEMKNERKFFDAKNCIFAEGTADIRLMKIFEEYLYLPVARFSYLAATKISRFQNGCLDTYLLYVFCAVIAIIVYLGWLA